MDSGQPPDWALRLVERRTALRWGRRELARRLRDEAERRGETQVPDIEHLVRSLRRWEAGAHRPSEWYRELLHTVLDADSGERVAAAAAGRAGADPDTADALASVVADLRHRDDTAPTGSLLAPAAMLAALTERLITDARPRNRRPVGRVAAEAAMLYWWFAVDAGQFNLARSIHDRAVALAVEWQAMPLVGHLLGWRAGLAMGQGDLGAAVRLARRARDLSWQVSPGGLAWAAAYEARAHLLAGDNGAMHRALDDAQPGYAAVRPDQEPPWLYWLAGPVLMLDSLDMRLLRDGSAAAPAVEAALSTLPAGRRRDAAWYRAHLAAARARDGDVEAAAADAAEAAELSKATGTTWTLAELRQLAGRPELHRLAEALADTA